MVMLPFKNNAMNRSSMSELDKFQRDISRIFDLTTRFGYDSDGSLLDAHWLPAVEVLDRADSVLVRAELPGLNRADIDVVIENNVLSIRGEKKEVKEERAADVIRSERYYGVFHRAFTLPSSVDADKVSAKFVNGVLELSIAKKEASRPKQIKVDVK